MSGAPPRADDTETAPGGTREHPPWLLLDARRARKEGPAAIAWRRRARLAEMVAHARANSPYYRELYRDLPERVEDLALLLVTGKKELMARFDDWTTDRAVTIEKVRAFVDDPDLVGERFLGEYTVATTSGTSGTRGISVMDDRSLAVTNALSLRMVSAWLSIGDAVRIVVRGGRMALVMASGGHFASAVAAARLNRFRPAIVAPYASTAALLAGEQEAGRLDIHPVLVALAAEGLPAGEYGRIARAFDARVGNSYAATECPFLSYGCGQGWYHVNGDWVVVEPVDAGYRPVPPGERSHTALVSNLANRVQPILRYDLGDSVLRRPDSCPCGDPLPAISVRGRAADVLTFLAERGEQVAVPPLAFATLVDRTPGVELFQIVQTTPTSLRMHLRPAAGADLDRVWRVVRDEITRLLASRGLDHVTVERAGEPPEQSPGGKYRTIIPLSRGAWG